MTSSMTRTGSAFARKTATRAITGGAMLAILAGGVLGTAMPANAAPGGPGILPQAEITTNIADIVQNVKVDAVENPAATPGVDLSWRSALITSFDLHVPNTAQPGDTVGIRIKDPSFRFLSFANVEIKNSAGELIGTASRAESNSQLMYIKFADAVATSSDIVGKVTVSAQPLQQREQHTATFSLFSNDGTVNLGPNTDYIISKTAPASTATLLTPAIYGNEVGLRSSTHSVGTLPADLSQVVYTAKPADGTKGLVPDCDASRIIWLSDGSYVTTDSGFTPKVISCDLATGEIKLGFPDGATAPADINGKAITGYTFSVNWIADKPQTEYSVVGSMVRATGQEGRVTTGKGTSPAIDGVAEGQVRVAATSITKTSNAPERLLVGGAVDYTITSSNDEELRTAYDVVITDQLPAGTEFVSATEGGVYDKATHTVTWPKADIAPAADRVVGVTVKVLDAAADTITNKASHIGSNTPKAEASVSDELTRVGLALDKQELGVDDTNADGTTGNAGDTIRYGFEVTNTGSAPEAAITLTDKLLGIDGQEIILDTALQPGEMILLPGDYSYIITEADETAGTVLNEATVTSPDGTPVSDTVETTTTPAPAATPTVVPAAPSNALATTGADSMLPAGIAGAVALLGLGGLLLRRRKTQA